MRKILLGFFLSFIIINFFVTTNLFLLWIQNFNKVSYFYLSEDWERKIDRSLTTFDKKTTVFLGSSRTAYGVAPRREDINLGLVGGSVNEMYSLSKFLTQNNSELKTIFLEINPMSMRQRHMKAMTSYDLNSLFSTTWLRIQLPWVFRFFYSLPIYAHRQVISDTLQDIFIKKNTPYDDYSKERKIMHLKEFEQISSPKYEGFIKGAVMSNKFFSEKFTRECFTMLRWNMGDPLDDYSEGLRVFDLTIQELSKIKARLILWVPPHIANENYGYKNEEIDGLINEIKNRHSNEVIDLRTHPALSRSDNFMDCIHPLPKTAEIITQELTNF